jgi:hypothetical protein
MTRQNGGVGTECATLRNRRPVSGRLEEPKLKLIFALSIHAHH